jgi:hypothetical protein
MVSIKKILIFSVIALFVIIIGVVAFFVLSNNTTQQITSSSPLSVSENQLTTGTYVPLKENGIVNFNLNNSQHKITIISLSSTFVNITIQSEIINFKLNIGDTKNIDLNNDGTDDISVVLEDIVDGKANLFLKKFVLCIENWNCSTWGTCAHNNQTRVCTDLNHCGTIQNKSTEVKSCLAGCLQLGGTFCDDNQYCNDSLINSSEGGNCCSGSCVLKETTDCGTNINCLINASEPCNPANATYSSYLTNTSWAQNVTYYYKIRGFEDTKCVLYREIVGIIGNYTSAERQALLDSGMTSAEINQSEIETNSALNTQFVGQPEICKFQVYDLESKLDDVKDGSPFMTSSERDTYECTGTVLEF